MVAEHHVALGAAAGLHRRRDHRSHVPHVDVVDRVSRGAQEGLRQPQLERLELGRLVVVARADHPAGVDDDHTVALGLVPPGQPLGLGLGPGVRHPGVAHRMVTGHRVGPEREQGRRAGHVHDRVAAGVDGGAQLWPA